MSILRVKKNIDIYAALAEDPDLHRLTGREGHHELTAFVNRQIVAAMDFTASCRVIDIGCGDGSLLAGIAPAVANGIGVAPNEAEVERLKTAYNLGNVQFVQGLADAVPVTDGSFDRVIINGVLLLLDEAAVQRCLRELKRVAAPGALVFIGEVPDRDELVVKNRYRGNSLVGFLWHKARYKGVRKALRSAKSLLRKDGRAQVILGQRMFWITPDEFGRWCQDAGLSQIWARAHLEVDAVGKERDSATRFDYLFRA